MIAKIKRLLGLAVQLFIVLPFVVMVLSLAVFNRQRVTADIFPLPFTIEMPLYLYLLGGLLIGFISGALWIWLLSYRHRAEAWKQSKRADKAEQELVALRATALKPVDMAD